MANLPISGFPTGGTIAQAGDEFVIARSGANYKLTSSSISAFVLGGPTTQLGAADVASGAVAQTLQVQSNTGAATTGPNFTIKGSSGTTAGGSIIFQTHNGTAYATALTINSSKDALFEGRLLSSGASQSGLQFFSGSSNQTSINYFIGGTSYPFATMGIIGGGTRILNLTSIGALTWSSNANADLNAFAPDLYIYRDAANTLALRNGTNAQTFNVYNTYTSAADYERGSFKWSSNVLTIASEKAGSGIARAMSFVDGGGTERINIAATSGVVLVADMQLVTSSSIGYIGAASSGFTLRYSSGANSDMMVRFTGITSSFPALKRSVTGIPLQVRLADDSGDAAFQCGTATSGGTAFNVNGTGGNSIASVTNTTTGTLLQVLNSTSNPLMTVTDTTSGTLFSVQSTTAATLFSVNDTTSGTLLAVTNSSATDVFTVSDAGQVVINGNANLFGEAANTLALRNGTSAQTFNIYSTYTDAANYERLSINYTGSNDFALTAAKAGTGSSRSLTIETYGLATFTVAAQTIATSSDGFYSWSTTTSSRGTANTRLYRDADGIIGVRGSGATSPAAMSFYTYGASPPASPAASIVRIYADTSGGKIRLMALFPSGVAQQIAIEP